MKITIEIEDGEVLNLEGMIVRECSYKLVEKLEKKIVSEFQSPYSPETRKRLEEVAKPIVEKHAKTLDERLEYICWEELYKKVKKQIMDAVDQVK